MLSSIVHEKVLIDPDGRILEEQERAINRRLEPFGVRLARDEDGFRQNVLFTRCLEVEPIDADPPAPPGP